MKKIINVLLLAIVFINVFACVKVEVIENVKTTEEVIKNEDTTKVVEIIEPTIEVSKGTIEKVSDNGETLVFGTIELEILEVEREAKDLNTKLDNAMNQLDMNEISSELYKLWDKELNDLWNRIKKKNDKTSMQQLIEDERVWVKDKEKKIKEAGLVYEGGSMRPLEENMVGASLTRERVYVLANILAKLLNEPEIVMPVIGSTDNTSNNVAELNMKGNYYSQSVAGNINGGIEWKYVIKNNCIKLEDEIVNFEDINSKTEIGDIVYSFRGDKEGDDSITWTLVDSKDNKVYFTVKFDFHVEGTKDKEGFLPFTLMKQTANDQRPVQLSEYRFDEPEVLVHAAGNG